MSALINTTGDPPDANDGALVRNPERVGNRRWGQKMFLSGQERVLETDAGMLDWYAFESLTVSTTALALTENLSELADQVLITVETATVRYRIDGQAPTASVGHVLNAGDVLELKGRFEIDKFQAIRKDGLDATARCSFGQRRFE